MMHHPGLELRKRLNDSQMSQKELAVRTGFSKKHISTVLSGEKNISPGFARKLGYIFETPKYWLDLQSSYDDEYFQYQEENSISEEEIEVLKHLKEVVSYLIEERYIPNIHTEAEIVMNLRSFLKVSNLLLIPLSTYNGAYRAQLKRNSSVDPYVLFAWQQLCEYETNNLNISNELDIKKIMMNLAQIKSLMFLKIKEFMPKLQAILAECGIAFKVIKNFRGAPVQGFIKETTSKKIIMCLTIRGKRADSFWFTLFHELGHLVNGDYSNRFIDFDTIAGEAEIKADSFAQKQLLEPKLFNKFLVSEKCTEWNEIVQFSILNNVPPFIVLGRLQKEGILDWSSYSNQVVYYDWAESSR